ncbi:MAG: hypothetical protein ABL930_06130 [Pseudobdellovibrio sp.]
MQLSTILALLLFILFTCELGLTQPRRRQGSMPTVSSISSASRTDPRFSIGLGYSYGLLMNFDSAYINADAGAKSSYKLYYSSSPMIDLNYRDVVSNDWGYIFGVAFDFGRKFTEGDKTVNGMTTILRNDTKLQTTLLSFCLAYRWENFYIPFGVNYPFYNFTNEGFVGTTKVSGSAYGKLGMGYYLNNNFMLEAYLLEDSRIYLKTDNGVIDDYGTGHVATSAAYLKYQF